MVGQTRSYDDLTESILLVKASSEGDSLWGTVLRGGTPTFCRAMMAMSDGGYLLGGYSVFNQPDANDFMLMRTTIDSTNLGDFSPVPLEASVITNELSGIVDIAVGDIDADGDMDVAAADMFADEIVAFENLDAINYSVHLIDDSLDGACSIDMRALPGGDDNLDLVACGRFDNRIRVYEQTQTDFVFDMYFIENDSEGKYKIVIEDEDPEHHALLTASIDGKVTKWGYAWVEHVLGYTLDFSEGDYDVDQLSVESFEAGHLDIVGSSRETGKVYWWQDLNGEHTEYEILSGVNLNAFDVADLNRDLDKDLICATTSGDLLWFENTGGEQFVKHEITTGMQYPFDIKAADINNDGFMDFVIADTYMDEISWWRNSGNGRFLRNILSGDFTQARTIEIVDFDSDGDLDIVGAGQNGIMLWKNGVITPDEEQPNAKRVAKSKDADSEIIMETTIGKSQLPTEFALLANHPNPFNATTTISFSLPVRTEVSITMHDILGRSIETLVSGQVEAGFHSVDWNGADRATGVYFIVMQTAEFRAVQKALLIK
jgi:hypothetical protein